MITLPSNWNWNWIKSQTDWNLQMWLEVGCEAFPSSGKDKWSPQNAGQEKILLIIVVFVFNVLLFFSVVPLLLSFSSLPSSSVMNIYQSLPGPTGGLHEGLGRVGWRVQGPRVATQGIQGGGLSKSNNFTNQKYTHKFVKPILRPWKNAWPCKRSVQVEWPIRYKRIKFSSWPLSWFRNTDWVWSRSWRGR